MGRPRSPSGRARETAARLASMYPEAECELDHDSPFQLIVATILSAQATDAGVNKATPSLFAAYPDAPSLAAASVPDVERLVSSIGLYRTKAANIVAMAGELCERFGGEVPTAMSDLVTLPGVGRKTANVVRSVGFDLPGLPVDTHVGRLARRLGLTTEEDPVKIERDLNPMVPASERGRFSLRLILHGRRVCGARTPHCDRCRLADYCPSSGIGAVIERVG